MMNVIAVFICAAGAVIWGLKGDMVWCTVEILLTALNMPFAIEWIKNK